MWIGSLLLKLGLICLSFSPAPLCGGCDGGDAAASLLYFAFLSHFDVNGNRWCCLWYLIFLAGGAAQRRLRIARPTYSRVLVETYLFTQLLPPKVVSNDFLAAALLTRLCLSNIPTYIVDVSCLKGKSLISFFYRYFLAFFTDLQLCDECSSLLSWSRYHYYGVKQLILAVCYRYVGFAPKLSWFYTLRPNTYQNPIKSTSCSPRGVC